MAPPQRRLSRSLGLRRATATGLTTTSLFHVVAALEWRDPYETIFKRDTFANTTELDGDQWRVCFIAVWFAH